jgi:peptidoglycan/LPS O-acetylase OafA/YrhL
VNVLVQFLVLGGISLLVSAVFFAFVERPCMDPRWPTRLATWLRDKGRVRPAVLRADRSTVSE